MTTIDIAGSLEHLVKWIAIQVLVFIAVILVGLSAPLLYTVGALWLASRAADSASTWAVIYLIVGPFACAFWMIFISHLPEFVAIFKRIPRLHSRDSYLRGSGKAIGFMFAGFFGSLLAEGIFTYAAHILNVIPDHLILFFCVAPFAVFAPCWMAVLHYWIKRDRYNYAVVTA